jgi:hypothetical protein
MRAEDREGEAPAFEVALFARVSFNETKNSYVCGPKGRDSIAQANGLGIGPIAIPSPKGAQA